jgi:NitT/TauT family transport system substrate-binding protein
MGWFAEEGVSVDVLNTAGGTEAVQLMIGGDADVSVTGPSTIFSSRQAGEPVIGVASTVQQLHLYPAVLADSPIQSVADFKGAVIGIPSLGTSLLPPLKAQIREAGLDPDADVEYVATGGAASTLAAYQSGDIDVLGLFDIAYALLEVDGYELRIFNDVNESPFLGTLAMGQGVITNADWVAANADTLVGFLRAMVKGEIFAKENPECAVRFHWSLFPESVPAGLDESDAFAQGLAKVRQRSTGQFADASGNWAMMVPEVMQNWHDFLLENGEIATAQDVANAWTNQYIEEANNFDKEAVAELARNTSC